jgi:hypothetical protein
MAGLTEQELEQLQNSYAQPQSPDKALYPNSSLPSIYGSSSITSGINAHNAARRDDYLKAMAAREQIAQAQQKTQNENLLAQMQLQNAREERINNATRVGLERRKLKQELYMQNLQHRQREREIEQNRRFQEEKLRQGNRAQVLQHQQFGTTERRLGRQLTSEEERARLQRELRRQEIGEETGRMRERFGHETGLAERGERFQTGERVGGQQFTSAENRAARAQEQALAMQRRQFEREQNLLTRQHQIQQALEARQHLTSERQAGEHFRRGERKAGELFTASENQERRELERQLAREQMELRRQEIGEETRRMRERFGHETGLAERGERFQTGERVGGQQFTAAENQLLRKHQIQQALEARQHLTAEREAGEHFRRGEREAGEFFTASENQERRELERELARKQLEQRGEELRQRSHEFGLTHELAQNRAQTESDTAAKAHEIAVGRLEEEKNQNTLQGLLKRRQIELQEQAERNRSGEARSSAQRKQLEFGLTHNLATERFLSEKSLENRRETREQARLQHQISSDKLDHIMNREMQIHNLQAAKGQESRAEWQHNFDKMLARYNLRIRAEGLNQLHTGIESGKYSPENLDEALMTALSSQRAGSRDYTKMTAEEKRSAQINDEREIRSNLAKMSHAQKMDTYRNLQQAGAIFSSI